MALALTDKMPKNEAIANEIKRLESVGESLMEHVYIVYAITKQTNWNLHYKQIETLRIRTLNNSNLIEKAKLLGLEQKLITNKLLYSDC
jgi:hypothetical protein